MIGSVSAFLRWMVVGAAFFPKLLDAFFIGVATSSYQIEGSNVGECIWDQFTQDYHLTPVGNATHHYVLFQEDVALMKSLGFSHYRFSISWNRILPEPHIVNQEGIDFYHKLLDTLKDHDIEPYVTLYHWDLPLYLTRDMNGWLDARIIDEFLYYSKILFREYGSKVKYWMTINEPLTTSSQGYGPSCNFAPHQCSIPNMYTSARHQLLAHAVVATFYKDHYGDQGKIGIVLNTNWIEPLRPSAQSKAQEAMDRMFGWFMDPLFFGTFPECLSADNPPFSAEEQQQLMNSLDFLGLNHYTTYYIDENGQTSTDPDWYPAQSTWLFDAPLGMKKILEYVQQKYTSDLPLFITESGFSQRQDGVIDLVRTHYLSGYLYETLERIQQGQTNILGFFAWSFLDNFEWASGYSERFGIIQVNFTDYSRHPKLSAYMLQHLNHLLED